MKILPQYLLNALIDTIGLIFVVNIIFAFVFNSRYVVQATKCFPKSIQNNPNLPFFSKLFTEVKWTNFKIMMHISYLYIYHHAIYKGILDQKYLKGSISRFPLCNHSMV